MAFTHKKLQEVFKNADGTAASGALQFTLLKRMTQPGETIVPSTITSNLNTSGELSVEVTSTEDSETVPTDARWRVDYRILGDAAESFEIKVPAGSGTVNLSTLLPNQPIGG